MSLEVSVFLAFFVCLLPFVLPHKGSFNFNFSDPNTVKENTKLEADAFYNNVKYISLTRNDVNDGLNSSTGRASYNQPIRLWDEKNEEVANFTTEFSFVIETVNSKSFGADGFTFFIAAYPFPLPPDPNDIIAGKYLGLFNVLTATKSNASANQVVAVEFDTFVNKDIDPSPDPNSTFRCHIGIDVNTIRSTNYTFIDNSLCFNSRMTARIDYSSRLQLLNVLLWHDTEPETKFNLNARVNIRKVLPNMATVGFSAATGNAFELHKIFSWSFKSTLELENNKRTVNVVTIVGIVACAILIFLLVIWVVTYYLKRKRSSRKATEIEEIDHEFEKGKGPKRFTYRELVEATNSFAENNKLGEGGFGSVYRGMLKDANIHVAVKRVSKESKQGKKEYISEVKTISQLRHRNLVQLVGWCHDCGEFLLVYELMHNASLDKHLYSKKSLLTWPIRHNISLGLGSALFYLHEEWEQCVVHRDIKPSNIMLDSLFNAKLGDFGLARLIDHNRDLETTIVAGTRGYIAPECFLETGKASTQSDVFSFGVLLLEITCGRRPIVPQHEQKKVSLVEWVWDLYGQNALLEAVDVRLNGNFKREEVERFMVVGLWCAHPDKSLRPSIKRAMSVLQFQAPLPILPQKMPRPIYDAPVFPDMQFYASIEATSSGAAATSAKSAPALLSDSYGLLEKQPNTF